MARNAGMTACGLAVGGRSGQLRFEAPAARDT